MMRGNPELGRLIREVDGMAVSASEKVRLLSEGAAKIDGIVFSALDQAISDATGLLDVASNSQNFRLAVKALSEGELALAERYLFGHGNLQYGGFMAELVDNGLVRPALVFKAKFYELAAKAKADAQQLKQDDPSEPYDG